ELQRQQERPPRRAALDQLEKAPLRLLERVVVADVDDVGAADRLEQLGVRRLAQVLARGAKITPLVRAKRCVLSGDRIGDELSLPHPKSPLQAPNLCARRPYRRCAAGSSSSMSFGDGTLRSSCLAIFHACWTTHESERSSRCACVWISESISSGK